VEEDQDGEEGEVVVVVEGESRRRRREAGGARGGRPMRAIKMDVGSARMEKGPEWMHE
jgi:hypothetical protein